MCSFVPFNVPILAGLLLSPPTIGYTAFFQFANQSYNAGLNYGNRNTSSTYTNQDLAVGFSSAVIASIFSGILLRKAFAPITAAATGASLIMLNSLV
jgi:hypothetical protein